MASCGRGDGVSKALFHEAVLPYANTNEARTNWRDLLWAELQPLMATGGPTNNSLAAAVMYLNQNMWSASVLGRHNVNGGKITFHGEMTPRYASCTDVSILYVDALRTIGVPARVTGTPAWHGGPGGASGPPQGNHNWVEVFVGKAYSGKENVDGWAFIEALPAGGGESLTNPCDKWFCSHTKGYGNGTRVYAALFSKSKAQDSTYYPMEREPANKGVPGLERTDIYAEWCNKC